MQIYAIPIPHTICSTHFRILFLNFYHFHVVVSHSLIIITETFSLVLFTVLIGWHGTSCFRSVTIAQFSYRAARGLVV